MVTLCWCEAFIWWSMMIMYIIMPITGTQKTKLTRKDFLHLGEGWRRTRAGNDSALTRDTFGLRLLPLTAVFLCCGRGDWPCGLSSPAMLRIPGSAKTSQTMNEIRNGRDSRGGLFKGFGEHSERKNGTKITEQIGDQHVGAVIIPQLA